MPTGSGEVPGLEDDSEGSRRAYKACLRCRERKRPCDNVRPCGQCFKRGIECKEEVTQLCKVKRLRCDRKRPCKRPLIGWLWAVSCLWFWSTEPATGNPNTAADEVTTKLFSWVKIQRRVRRQHDTAVEDGFSSFDATLVRQQPETAGEGSDHLTGLNWNAPYSSPEYPLAFPEGPMQVWGRVDSNGARAPCPRVLRYLFKVHRLGQDLLDHMLASMPPKLLATTLSVCNSIDVLLAKLKSAGSFVQPPDDLPGWALKSQEWQESERIGRLVVRVDKHFSVMTGID
eukprot:2756346-Rhodomonas_salina.1